MEAITAGINDCYTGKKAGVCGGNITANIMLLKTAETG